jgi:hypothetical protein
MVGLAAESTAPVQVPVLGNSTLCTDNGGGWSRERLSQEGVFLFTGSENVLL